MDRRFRALETKGKEEGATLKDLVVLMGEQNRAVMIELANTKKASNSSRVRVFTSGEPDDWLIFKRHLQMTAGINKWTDERAIQEMGNAMDGGAARRVEDVNVKVAGMTLDAAIKLYEDRFLHSADSQLARAAFNNCRQKEGESALDWHSRCRALHVRAWQNRADRETAEDLIYRFIHGIHNPAIFCRVLEQNPTTYALALVAAQNMEAVTKTLKARHDGDRKGTFSLSTLMAGIEEGAPAVAAFPGRAGGPGRNRTGRFESRNPAEGGQGKACWFCNSTTHLKADCRKYKAEMGNGGGRGRGQARGRGPSRGGRGGFGRRPGGRNARVGALGGQEDSDEGFTDGPGGASGNA